MEKLKIKLKNEDGLHARPAALFVQVSSKYDSSLTIEAHGVEVDGKSIIGVMSLGAFYGEEITLTAEGQDAKQMIKELENLIENKFEGY